MRLPVASRAFALSLVMAVAAAGQEAGRPDFAHDVAPILARCTECHGPVRQRKGLRLDGRAAILRGGRSGPAIVPGDPDASLVAQRVSGIGKRMPPSGEGLDRHEIATLRAWIAAGASMPEGAATDPRPWSHRPITRPAVPGATGAEHPIDAFVRERLQREGLAPAPAEERGKLLRRVSLDLIGLPPSVGDLDTFLADVAPDAYERAIDRLLASPRFGERWAASWLDLARYADTKGYEKDARREIWRWRDYVIDAFNRDVPFDQFTVQQLAGDLLPGATVTDKVATAFHRNTMTNDEGGTDDEEFRVAAVVDRVNTTFAVWMGTTIGCCQCHDHKYDAFSQREYYQLFAFFDNTEDDDHESERPTIEAPTPELQATRAALARRRADLVAALAAQDDEHAAAGAEWLAAQRRQIATFDRARVTMSPWRQSGPHRGRSFGDAFDRAFLPETEPQLARWTSAAYRDGEVHTFTPGDNMVRYLERTVRAHAATVATFALGSDDAIKVWWNGELKLARRVDRAAARDQERVTVTLPAGEGRLLLKVVNGGGPSGFAFELCPLPMAAAEIDVLRQPGTAGVSDRERALFRAHAPALQPLRDQIAAVDAELSGLQVPTVPVLQERPAARARVTRLHRRGSFLDQGEPVARAVPAALHPLPSDAPRDRLGLARWIAARDNPLTARVIANRFWEQIFGVGLVETSDEFGAQGEPPSHPELLDWLASEFMDRGWSVKALLRAIVTSATYAQSSALDASLRARDPNNRLLARGPRGRLSAEALRDQALFVAGLLSAKIGGPSVMPPQPDGVWSIIYSNDAWMTSAGEDRHRRALYTFWRRTSPYPSMLAFDAPSREYCVVRRVATNTPLQALVTLNDPVFVEAAAGLAERMRAAGVRDAEAGLAFGFRACTGRPPTARERARLLQLYTGELHAGGRAEDAWRAWRVVANVLLNLDETLTKG